MAAYFAVSVVSDPSDFIVKGLTAHRLTVDGYYHYRGTIFNLSIAIWRLAKKI